MKLVAFNSVISKCNQIRQAAREEGWDDSVPPARIARHAKRELEYRIPINITLSRKLPEVSGDFCKNKTSFL